MFNGYKYFWVYRDIAELFITDSVLRTQRYNDVSISEMKKELSAQIRKKHTELS